MAAGTKTNEPRFQLRKDLQLADYPIGFLRRIVVKDPLKMEYFLFDSLEQSLLQFLHQPRTLSELKNLADEKFAEAKIEIAELKQFVMRLINDNLIMAETTGAGSSLLAANKQSQRSKWLRLVFGVLAIRFRGINPQNFLDAANPITKHLFQPAFLWLAGIAFVSSMLALVLNIEQFINSDYLWQSIRHARILVPIALSLMLVKFLHELGHAFACRSIGRECNELGVLLLAFVPCLYCNVSDVWMEPKRSKRMLVSAAGIYIEMIIAAACVPLYLLSHSGELQIFWFTLMTICSVNTILINGNPLLRYDGYYLLSDAVGIPNLYSEAQQAFNARFSSMFVDGKTPRPFSWLEVYGLAAFIYRYLIIGFIISAIYLFFARMELATAGTLIAILLAAVTLSGTAYGSGRKLLRLSQQRGGSQIRSGRASLAIITVLAILASILYIPVQTSVYSEGIVTFSGNRVVFAPESGEIDWAVSSGDRVRSGELLANIKSRSLEAQMQQQDLYIAETKKSLEHLQILLSQGVENTREIELQKDALTSAEKIADELRLQAQRLRISAEVDGAVVATPSTALDTGNSFNLQRATSTLLPKNNHAFVRAGEPIAVIGSSDAVVIRLQVPEHEVARISTGQVVDVLISQYSPETISGTVSDIAIDKSDFFDEAEAMPSNSEFLLVDVLLDEKLDNQLLNSKVKASIHGQRITIYTLLSRFLAKNFSQ